MRLLKTKNNKEINLDFSIYDYPILDFKFRFKNGKIWLVELNLFWISLNYSDWSEPF